MAIKRNTLCHNCPYANSGLKIVSADTLSISRTYVWTSQ